MNNIDKIINKLLLNAIPANYPYDTVRQEFNQFIDLVSESFYLFSDKQLELVDKKICKYKLNPKTFALGLAIKINISRRFIKNELPDLPISLNVINPVYRERNRMSSQSKYNPFGENSILEKIKIFRRLEILSNKKLNINFWVVDDVCPEKSGKFAEKIIKNNFPKQFLKKYHVLYLEEAILRGIYPNKNSNYGSIKGASIHYALKTILENGLDGSKENLFFDTDADLSIHPELIGILLKKYYRNNAVAIIGSRRETDSLAIIEHKRDTRGRLYIAIIQKLLPGLGAAKIWDTNRGAKLYNKLAVETIVKCQSLWQFPYQIEHILIILEKFPHQVFTQGICYIDSIPLSTSIGRFTYYKQIIDQIYLSDKFFSNKYEYNLKQLLINMGENIWNFFEKNTPLVILKKPINKLGDLQIAKILEKNMPNYKKNL